MRPPPPWRKGLYQIKEILLQTNLFDFLADFHLTYVRNMLHIHDYLIKHKIRFWLAQLNQCLFNCCSIEEILDGKFHFF